MESHRNLYNDYYSGFHNEVWEINEENGLPLYKSRQMEFSSEAMYYAFLGKEKRCTISLLNSVLVVAEGPDSVMPMMLIPLEGLAVKKYFAEDRGYGIEISHREGVYPVKMFTFLHESLQAEWMDHLKYYKGSSINQLYDMGDKIGIGKFSIVYKC